MKEKKQTCTMGRLRFRTDNIIHKRVEAAVGTEDERAKSEKVSNGAYSVSF
jgi:hypothetical protein